MTSVTHCNSSAGSVETLEVSRIQVQTALLVGVGEYSFDSSPSIWRVPETGSLYFRHLFSVVLSWFHG